jgi:nifR3 family TIM-barrel protein
MSENFWSNLEKPFVGLAPMDGITDAAFRKMVVSFCKPDVLFTEFTSVEGICAGALKPLNAFIYDEEEHPIVAQLFGTDPECFYKAFFVIADLGFDGIDINMGCPAKVITTKGAGAALIKTPELAAKIIISIKKAANDWANGKNIDEVNLPKTIIEYVTLKKPANVKRRLLPVSIKTRTGYENDETEKWITFLSKHKPDALTLHGRYLAQMYTGLANYVSILKASKIAKEHEIIFLGNGDIKSIKDGREKAEQYELDGFLIGRAALGKPWIFSQKEINRKDTFSAAIKHAQIYEILFQNMPFVAMRKHLAWYCKNFAGATEIRRKLMATNNTTQVKELLENVNIGIEG